MIPVAQTRSGLEGNCFAACVASILELPLSVLPEYEALVPEAEWYDIWQAWLRARNLWLISWTWQEGGNDLAWIGPGYWILSAESPRLVKPDGTPALHAMVMEGDRVAWDPHEPHTGHVGRWRRVAVLRVLDPTAVVQSRRAALREAAELECEGCRRGIPLKKPEYWHLEQPYADGNQRYISCRVPKIAAAIELLPGAP